MNLRNLFYIAFAAWVLVGALGCSTVEEDGDLSSRPWNRPRYWEHSGLPSSIYEDR